uniref:Membrane protein, putative n=1 Tax=Babesia bovis TaxID=5865 RepID=A7AQM1_BABBO|eukprot:XP_001610408.1 hypothetical protein [Babesia bovis T2Bo]
MLDTRCPVAYVFLSSLFVSSDGLHTGSKARSRKGFMDIFGLTGDIAPSTYPVIKLNQNVNNDSSFTALRRSELADLQSEAWRLMSLQRRKFTGLRKDLNRQLSLMDDLAVAMERQ